MNKKARQMIVGLVLLVLGLQTIAFAEDNMPLTLQSGKYFTIWVGDKNNRNVPGATVTVNGVPGKWTTNSKGEARVYLTYGPHCVKAYKDSCSGYEKGVSKCWTFTSSMWGVAMPKISGCP